MRLFKLAVLFAGTTDQTDTSDYNMSSRKEESRHSNTIHETTDIFNKINEHRIKRKKRGRIVGGTDVTKLTDYPFFGSMRSASGNHFCGAVIIDEKHILTAVHCTVKGQVESTRPSQFWAGLVKRRPYHSEVKQKLTIQKCIVYPTHKIVPENGVHINDFRICETKDKIKLDGKFLKPAVIGTENEFKKYVKTGKANCEVVGFGKSKDMKSRTYETYLQKARMHYDQKLTEYYEPTFKLGERGFIISPPDKSKKGLVGACTGDSGGPFICNIKGTKKIFGVAGFAETSCKRFSGFWFPDKSWIEKSTPEKSTTPKPKQPLVTAKYNGQTWYQDGDYWKKLIPKRSKKIRPTTRKPIPRRATTRKRTTQRATTRKRTTRRAITNRPATRRAITRKPATHKPTLQRTTRPSTTKASLYETLRAQGKVWVKLEDVQSFKKSAVSRKRHEQRKTYKTTAKPTVFTRVPSTRQTFIQNGVTWKRFGNRWYKMSSG